jgi:hypothetical protein
MRSGGGAMIARDERSGVDEIGTRREMAELDVRQRTVSLPGAIQLRGVRRDEVVIGDRYISGEFPPRQAPHLAAIGIIPGVMAFGVVVRHGQVIWPACSVIGCRARYDVVVEVHLHHVDDGRIVEYVLA